MEFIPEKLNLHDIIETNILLLKSLAEEKFIQIDTDVSKEVFVYADCNMLNTILRNLITNAIKFTNGNGKILIAAKDEDPFISVSVKDNGVGISEKDREYLFELGNELTRLGTKNEKGSGLGLILCKEFVDAHGGKIWVESQKDQGSTFFFTISKFNSFTI